MFNYVYRILDLFMASGNHRQTSGAKCLVKALSCPPAIVGFLALNQVTACGGNLTYDYDINSIKEEKI